MKNITILLSFFIFTFTAIKAATVIQITKTNTGTVSTFRLGIESEEVYTTYYDQGSKIMINLNSWYPQWNNNFADVSISVAAPQGAILQTGSVYQNLYLFGFYPNKPQIDWGILDGDSISMNEPNNQSWFSVLEMANISGQTFGRLALDAYDGNGGFISVRHNSNTPLSIPEPGAPMITIWSLLLFWRRRRR